MKVSDLPFNQALGIAVGVDGAITLRIKDEHKNHLGTAHASVIYAIAEACSGEWIIRTVAQQFPNAFAVTRAGNIQYKKPGGGTLTAQVAKASIRPTDLIQQISSRNMSRVTIDVQVNSTDITVATAAFEWLIQKPA
jgi:acyl-coenzyme A thioesterase PaaI-like protein